MFLQIGIVSLSHMPVYIGLEPAFLEGAVHMLYANFICILTAGRRLPDRDRTRVEQLIAGAFDILHGKSHRYEHVMQLSEAINLLGRLIATSVVTSVIDNAVWNDVLATVSIALMQMPQQL